METNDDLSIEMDSVMIKALTVTDTISKEYRRLQEYFNNGYFEMTEARYKTSNMRKLSPKYFKVTNASTSVKYLKSYESGDKWLLIDKTTTEHEDSDDHISSGIRNRSQGKFNSKSKMRNTARKDSMKESAPSNNSYTTSNSSSSNDILLANFGFNISPHLRQSQRYFKGAVHILVNIGSLKKQLSDLLVRYDLLQTMKNEL